MSFLVGGRNGVHNHTGVRMGIFCGAMGGRVVMKFSGREELRS